jgi:hypothetical protein
MCFLTRYRYRALSFFEIMGSSAWRGGVLFLFKIYTYTLGLGITKLHALFAIGTKERWRPKKICYRIVIDDADACTLIDLTGPECDNDDHDSLLISSYSDLCSDDGIDLAQPSLIKSTVVSARSTVMVLCWVLINGSDFSVVVYSRKIQSYIQVPIRSNQSM